MPTGNTQIETANTPAPAGVFLPETRHQRNFSMMFWIDHSDLLPEQVGCVLQAGIEKTGELIPVEDCRTGVPVLSLIFDARLASRDSFSWQLTRANSEGRVVTQVTVGRSTLARQLEFDVQGRLSCSRDLDAMETGRVMAELEDLASHRLIEDQAQELRAKRVNVERQEAELFAKLHRFSVEKFKKDSERLQKKAMHIGFVALKPF